MASLELQKVSKVFRQDSDQPIIAVDELSLSVADGEYLSIVGPSGCGKTTTLRMIAGLETPTAGEILIGGKPAQGLEPDERDLAMVFQRDALLPHLNAQENIALGLRLRHVPRDESERRMREALTLLGLQRLAERMPKELSGGERQRVALARAIVRKPQAFLFDEPLAGLDPLTRAHMRIELARLHRHLGATILHVTHDQSEALALGQRVAVIDAGRLQQVAPAAVLQQEPATSFVASFVGDPPMNLLRGHVVRKGGQFFFVEHNVPGSATGRQICFELDGSRGERLALIADGNLLMAIPANDVTTTADATKNRAEVELIEPMRDGAWIHVTTGVHRLAAFAGGNAKVRVGEFVNLSFDLKRACYFNPVSEKPIAGL